MQVWDQVKVIKDKSKFEGHAGLVTKVEGETITVKLDIDGKEHPFAVADLQHLGR